MGIAIVVIHRENGVGSGHHCHCQRASAGVRFITGGVSVGHYVDNGTSVGVVECSWVVRIINSFWML